jgi:hypothetical protein
MVHRSGQEDIIKRGFKEKVVRAWNGFRWPKRVNGMLLLTL